LQWSRSQTGNIPFSPEKFAINELIDANILLSENLINEKNLKIEHNLKEDIVVYADKNMINTVIRNLLTNAIKFTENGGISIEISANRSQTQIVLKDTGVGIATNKLETLFKIGGMKSTQGTRGESGTGLGLILCKEFIEKNGGSIFAKSEAGKGSTFGLSLPNKKE
jgi:signal transduction histidine kinase